MKKRYWVISIVGIVAVLSALALLLVRRSTPYEGLASHFPSKTAVYVEIRELGQWMPPSLKGNAPSSSSKAEGRGIDPMLQVLGQVWAAQPIRPEDLPGLLRRQPAALGVWFDGSVQRGALLVQMAPGQAALLKSFMLRKLGEGKKAGVVSGVELRRAPDLSKELNIKDATFVWGVSKDFAVMATTTGAARSILEKQAAPLSKDHAFLATLRHLPGDKGAILFIRGSSITKLIKAKRRAIKCRSKEAALKETESREESKAVKTLEQGDGARMVVGEALAGAAQKGLYKILAPNAFLGIGLWTSPPPDPSTGWRVNFWAGFKGAPTGLWRLAAEGREIYPSIYNLLPRDGRMYAWAGGKDPARLYQIALDELQKDFPPGEMGWIRAGIGAAEGKLNLSFANDLLPSLGDESCVVIAPDGKEERWGFFMTLRDRRRFEYLLTNNIAPQFHLKRKDFKGAEVWSMVVSNNGKFKRLPKLVLSGAMVIITNDPNWALSTGNAKGKSYKRFVKASRKAAGIVVFDPGAWSRKSNVFTKIVWHADSSGIAFEARFPGEPPTWNWKALKKAFKEESHKPQFSR